MSAGKPIHPDDAAAASGEGAEPSPTYEVGYRRPPKHSQFKKGQSGNRNGRPKGRKSVRAFVDSELDKKIPVTLNGRRKLISKAEAIATQHVNKALSGDPKAMQSLLGNERSSEAEAKAAAAAGGYGPRELKVVDQLTLAELVSRIRAVDEPIQPPQPPAATATESDATVSDAPAVPDSGGPDHDAS